jgi:hypothetical protein
MAGRVSCQFYAKRIDIWNGESSFDESAANCALACGRDDFKAQGEKFSYDAGLIAEVMPPNQG